MARVNPTVAKPDLGAGEFCDTGPRRLPSPGVAVTLEHMPRSHARLSPWTNRGLRRWSASSAIAVLLLTVTAAPSWSGDGAGAAPTVSASDLTPTTSATTPAPAPSSQSGASGVERIGITVPDEPSVEPLAPLPTPTVDVEKLAKPTVTADQPIGARDVATPVITTGSFGMVGVTWPADVQGARLGAEVRVRTKGRWSTWTPLETAGDGPDVTRASPNVARGGTEPLWVGDADAVQARFAAAPAGQVAAVELVLVNSEAATTGGGPAKAFGPVSADQVRGGILDVVQPMAVGGVTTPSIITRAGWGADDSIRNKEAYCNVEAPTLNAAVVHHTVTSNDYTTVAEAKAIMRSMYRYHVLARGFCDIGYNFVIDKWGNVYEGVNGSIGKSMVGAHAKGFNTGTVGISMMGDFTNIAPSAAQRESVARIAGWKLAQFGRNPSGRVVLKSLSTGTMWNEGQAVNLPVVMGHRAVSRTACPGNTAFPYVVSIASRADTLGYAEPLVRALYADMLGRGVDSSGLRTWSAKLAAGASPAAIARSLGLSEEYARRRVTAAYVETLGRQPDPTGLISWTQAVVHGVVDVDSITASMMGSAEFYLHAGGTDRAFITAVYGIALKRAPGNLEVAHWVKVIAAQGRGAAIHGVVGSLESAGVLVDATYQTFLKRGVDPTGRVTWAATLLRDGVSAVRLGLISSREYRGKSGTRTS